MTNLKDILQRAQSEGWAVGHFNVSNLEFLKAVAQAAGKLKAPVMIGASEGERDFLGVKALPQIVSAYAEMFQAALFLNADHTKTVERAKEAIDAGFISVHFDGSGLPLEDNIEQTKEVVRYARAKNAQFAKRTSGKGILPAARPPDISIEGEVGYLRGASVRTQEKIEITAADYTRPEEAARFVEATGVDRLAVAVGNVHGINLDEPRLDFELISRIREAVGDTAALVLHAGSGIPDSDIRRALQCGIANIHISTELREAWREALAGDLADFKTKAQAPYRMLESTVSAIQKIVENKIQLFGSENKM